MNLTLKALTVPTATVRWIAPLLALAALAHGAPALADLPDNIWVTCQTNSQGRQYKDADYGTQSSRNRTITDCTNNFYTNGGECRYNVECEGDAPGQYARCTTQSQGHTFKEGGLDANATRDAVLNACTSNFYTNAGECRYNVRCEGGYTAPTPPPYYPPTPPPYNPPTPPTPPPYYPPTPPAPGNDGDNTQVVCSTTSNGRSFSVPGRGAQTTLSKVIYVCQLNQFTDKAACQYNAYCK